MQSEVDEMSGPEATEMAVDFDHPVVDPDEPGFASLLPLLRGILDGQFDVAWLDSYVNHLRPRLNSAYSQVEAMLEQPYEQMGFAEEHLLQLRAAFSATQATMQELHQVLLLCESFLETNHDASLVEAEERLALVQHELRQVLS